MTEDHRKVLLCRVSENEYDLVRATAQGRDATLSEWLAEAAREKLARDDGDVSLGVARREAEIERLSAAAAELIEMSNTVGAKKRRR